MCGRVPVPAGGPRAGLPLSPSSGWPPSEPVEAATRWSSWWSSWRSPSPSLGEVGFGSTCANRSLDKSEGRGDPRSARLPPVGLRSMIIALGRVVSANTDVRARSSPSSMSCSRVATHLRHPRRLSGAVPATSLRFASRSVASTPFRAYALLRNVSTRTCLQQTRTRSASISTDPHPHPTRNDSHTRVRARR